MPNTHSLNVPYHSMNCCSIQMAYNVYVIICTMQCKNAHNDFRSIKMKTGMNF